MAARRGIRRGPGAAEHSGHKAERSHAFQFLGPARRHLHATSPCVFERRVQQPGLADAGLALEEDDRAPTGFDQVQRVCKYRDLRLAGRGSRTPAQSVLAAPRAGQGNSRQPAIYRPQEPQTSRSASHSQPT